MSKAVKLTNNNFLSTQYVVHKRGGGWYYLNNLLDNIYPIGSIFLTVNDANPSTYFGGTWVKMSGGYLYGCVNSIGNSSYTGSSTQGHALTINEMPAHKHNTTWLFSYGQNSAYGITWTNGNYQGPYTDALGAFHMDYTGGNQAHSHNIAYIGVWVWKRIS